ncbi:MAG: hypothetical protein GVY36_17890, partial [Verrucomicrobia bacterium]|nr:hypothetical protein [Verrucomicrobiota bacterium]
MSTAAEKYSKREAKTPVYHNPLSERLKFASQQIDRGEITEALQELDDLAATYNNQAEEIGKILALAGDAQMATGQFAEAAATYRKIVERLPDDSLAIRIWIRPAMGEIRALLKAVRPREALASADKVWHRARRYHADLEAQMNTTNRELRKHGKIHVAKRPIRPSVVLSGLGNAFLEEGYIDSAKEFYQQAVLTSPNGASRARQGLAQIALAEDRNSDAEQYARESIQMGKFQAKTVAAWPVLINARFKQGKDPLDEELFTSLNLNRDGRVRARAIHAIVKALRVHGDERWQKIAEEWALRETVVDEVIEFELAKMILADQKLVAGNPRLIALAAFRILRSPKVSPSEMVATCKDIVQMKIVAGSTPDFSALAGKVERRFGPAVRDRAIHAMALGAMLAKGHDLARAVLTEQIAKLSRGSEQWGKGTWALARMEVVVENYSAAADHYLSFADQPEIAQRFRVQALLRWAQCLQKTSGESASSEQIEGRLNRILSGVDDCHVLLDVGRDLVMLGGVLDRRVRQSIIATAEEAANQAFREAETPGKALDILIHLTRRQRYEFGSYPAIVGLWESLKPEKRAWLWSRRSDYWEYLALLFESYVRVDRLAEAEALAKDVIENADAPPEGYLFMGTVYGDFLKKGGRKKDSLETYT